MKVALLLVTHDGLGEVMLRAATEILGVCPLPADSLAAAPGCNPDELLDTAGDMVRRIENGAGVLVLTDLYGATPSNIACRLRDMFSVRIVAGLNLPMLIRVLNYPDLDLDELAHKAVSGGRDGVLTLEQLNRAD